MADDLKQTYRNRENRLRRLAKQCGLKLSKSKRRNRSVPGCGLYALIDRHTGNPVTPGVDPAIIEQQHRRVHAAPDYALDIWGFEIRTVVGFIHSLSLDQIEQFLTGVEGVIMPELPELTRLFRRSTSHGESRPSADIDCLMK